MLQTVCAGGGTMTLAAADPETSSWPPPPHQESHCEAASVSVTTTFGSTGQSSSIQQVGMVSTGSVWPAAEGKPLHLRVRAPKGTVWAVVVASSTTSR